MLNRAAARIASCPSVDVRARGLVEGVVRSLPLLLPELEGVRRRRLLGWLETTEFCEKASEAGEKKGAEDETLSQGEVGSESDDAVEFGTDAVVDGVGRRLVEP